MDKGRVNKGDLRLSHLRPSGKATTGTGNLSGLKRSSWAAELEQDPTLSSSRRLEKSQTFANQMAKSTLDKKLILAQDAQRLSEERVIELQREVDRLESDRRFLAEREKEEREEKEAERALFEEERNKSGSLLRTLRSQLLTLQGSYDDLKDSQASLTRSHSIALSNMKAQSQTLQHQVMVLESEVGRFKERERRNEEVVRELREALEAFETGDGNTIGRGGEREVIKIEDDLEVQGEVQGTEEREGEGEREGGGAPFSPLHATTPVGSPPPDRTTTPQAKVWSRQPSVYPAPRQPSRTPQPQPHARVSRTPHDRTSRTPAATPSPKQQQPKDWQIVQASLTSQTAHLRALEADNVKLKAEVILLRQRTGNVEILKEEKKTLERRVEGVEGMRRRVGQLERECERLKGAAAAATSMGAVGRSGVGGSSSPGSTPAASNHAALITLQTENANLLTELGTLRTNLSLLASEKEETEGILTSLKGEMMSTKQKVVEVERRAGRTEVLLGVEKRESGMLRGLIASYEAERALSSNGAPSSASDPAGGLPNQDTALLSQRIESLQTSLTELQTLNAQMDERLRGAFKMNNVQLLVKERKRAEDAEKELQTLRGTTETHLTQIDTLEQKLFDLQGDVASGSHVPPGVRVLEMKDNPVRRWDEMRKEALDGLRRENEALLGRLKVFEERVGGGGGGGGSEGDRGKGKGKEGKGGDNGGGSGSGSVPKESWDRINREKEVLEEVVAQRDKRLLRLQQVFTSKSHEFREAISSILGFNLAFYPNGQVRVTSQYDLGASFVFQPGDKEKSSDSNNTDGGTGDGGRVKMQLIGQGQGGPEDVPQLLRYWVEREGCIPGFMASVTLECWEKMKRDRPNQ